MKNIIAFGCILIIVLISCVSNDQNKIEEEELTQYLNELESEYETICNLPGWKFGSIILIQLKIQ
jgi:hypothetical protein